MRSRWSAAFEGTLSIVVLLTTFAILGCHEAGESPTDGTTVSLSTRDQFETHYKQWLEHRKRPDVMASSDSDVHTNSVAYRRIIALEEAALPYIMEKMAAGEFLLNKAVSEITGISITETIGEGDVLPIGEQETSQLWLDWWAENKPTPDDGK